MKRGCPPRHGLSKTKIHNTWCNMHRRCYDKTVDSFGLYGGRGIGVCKRWHIFENFFEDMGDVPVGMSLDRINSDLDYLYSNCKWSTPKQQARNRRTNRSLKLNGRTMLVCEWAEELDISPFIISTRLHRGWPVVEALMGRNK